MAFKKGTSGNPAGRPKGSVNKDNEELREMIRTRTPNVLAVVFDKADEGDLYACKLILDRCIPTLKSVEQKIVSHEKITRGKGLTQETVNELRREILGIPDETE